MRFSGNLNSLMLSKDAWFCFFSVGKIKQIRCLNKFFMQDYKYILFSIFNIFKIDLVNKFIEAILT